MLRKTIAALVIAAAIPAAAEEAARINSLDFMVEWPNLVDRKILLTGGRVVAASEQFMLLQLKGGNVTLRGWEDREDLRHLLKNCTSVITSETCDVAVTGTVKKSMAGGTPSLVDVDFFAPIADD